MAYQVKIDVFEGPFDLLLHLVRVHEMDIYDIRIAEITKAYLDYLGEMERLDLEVTGEFLVMAATLINLKSRSLMPIESEEEEEEEEELDEEASEIRDAQDLMRRLIEYREFKELAAKLSRREEDQLRLFYRNSVLPAVEGGGGDEDIREDINLLFAAFARVLEFTEGRPSHHVLQEEFHVEEKIVLLREQLRARERVSVTDLFGRCVNKQEAIALFLAMLEICKMKLARVRQSVNYDEIFLMPPGGDDDDEEEV